MLDNLTNDEQELLVKILEEDSQDSRDFWEGLSDHERQWVISTLSDEGVGGLNKLWEIDYIRRVPSIHEILDANYIDSRNGEETNYYLGADRKFLYPYWEHELRMVLDESSNIFEFIETGPIGGGKTVSAVMGNIVKLVQLSCLRRPHSYYKLMSGVPIVFSLFNVTMERADLSAYTQIKNILNNAQYFRDNFPVDHRRVVNDAEDDDFKYAIKLPNNIKFILGSKPDSAISANVIGGILDEVNFKELKTAKNTEGYKGMVAFQLYSNVLKRIVSRFGTDGRKFPGLLCNVSSRKSTVDFLEEHINTQEGQDAVCHCQELPHSCGGKKTRIVADALYKMKPKGTFSSKTFRVQIGNQFVRPKILDPEEPAAPECQVEDVPEDFRQIFETDIDGSIRDVCGIATFSNQPYLRNVERYWACVNKSRKNPFPDSIQLFTEIIKDSQGTVIGTHGPTMEDFLIKEALVKHAGTGYQPRHHPYCERFVHLDLSINNDCTGMAMGCICRTEKVKRKNDDGSFSESIGPVIWFDFFARIVPRTGLQIDYEKIRQFILTLRNIYNFPIKRVSTDQFQSTYLRQLLEKEGFETKKISMDTPKDENPLVARMAIYEARVDMPEFKPLTDEIMALYHDVANRVVDHRQGKSKDVFDAFGGVVCSIGLEKLPDTILEVATKKPEVVMPSASKKNSTFVNQNQVFGDLITRVSED